MKIPASDNGRQTPYNTPNTVGRDTESLVKKREAVGINEETDNGVVVSSGEVVVVEGGEGNGKHVDGTRNVEPASCWVGSLQQFLD